MLRKLIREVWPFLALAAVVVAFPLVFRNAYLQRVGAMIGLYSIIALGLCLLIGYAGQISLGHAAFYGIGAYTSAILSTRANLNPWIGLVAGVAVTCLVAYAVGRPTLRLRGHYLAMATLGFGIIVQIGFTEMRDLTGGFSGLSGIPRFEIGALAIKGNLLNYYLIWSFAILALAVSSNIVRSRVGHAMRAIHDSEVAALACGVDVARYKTKVFVLSAAFASVAGSLYAHYVRFISPDPFGLARSVDFLVMVIVGGARNIWGALLGAALMTAVGQGIEKTEAIKDLSTVVNGLVLILFVIFMPNGLVEVLRSAARGLSGLRRRAPRD